MNLPKHAISSLLIALLLPVIPSAAQEERQVKLQFVTFPAYSGEKPLELYSGEGESIPIELPSTALSRVYTLKGVSSCILGQTETDDEGNSKFTKFGGGPLLNSDEQVILVLRKGGDASEGLTLIPFSNDASGFTGGRYLMMNASTVDIAGQLGTDKFLISPNKHTLLAPKPSRAEGDRKYLNIKIFFRKGDTTQNFYSNIWRYSDRARNMVFIYHDPHTKQLRTQTIRNYPER